MRLFITSYQKSGTHQIMPAFEILEDVVDRSHNGTKDLPEYVGLKRTLCTEGIEVTAKRLREFGGNLFGHISYLPEYAEAIQVQPTKVLFNVRDPRDVVVAEYHNILKVSEKDPRHALWNFTMASIGTDVLYSGDPIKYLIEFAACRWPNWLGWLKHDFVLKVKYEDLRLNGLETLQKIGEWLAPEIKINPAWNFELLKPKRRNPTFRKGTPGDWKETFTDKHKEQAEKQLGDIIVKLGYTV